MKRPLAVTIVAGFFVAASFVAWMVGAALLHPTQLTDWLFTLNPTARAGFNAMGWTAIVLLFALGCGTLAASLGLRRGRPWAWWFAVTLFVVSTAGDVIALFILRDWLRNGSGVLVGVVFLLALLQPRVKTYCRR